MIIFSLKATIVLMETGAEDEHHKDAYKNNLQINLITINSKLSCKSKSSNC